MGLLIYALIPKLEARKESPRHSTRSQKKKKKVSIVICFRVFSFDSSDLVYQTAAHDENHDAFQLKNFWGGMCSDMPGTCPVDMMKIIGLSRLPLYQLGQLWRPRLIQLQLLNICSTPPSPKKKKKGPRGSKVDNKHPAQPQRAS